MKQFLKSIGSAITGILIFLGISLLGLFYMKGSLWFRNLVFPWFSIIFFITIFIDIIILLPLSIIKKTKIIGLFGLLISSYIFGLLLWVWSFLIVYSVWGGKAVIIGLLLEGVGIVPIAIMELILISHWITLLEFAILIIMFYGMKIIANYIIKKRILTLTEKN